MPSLDDIDWFPTPWLGVAVAILLVAWWGTERYYQRLGRDPQRKLADRGSRKVAGGSVYLSIILSFLIRWFDWDAVPTAGQYSGLVLMAVGMVIRGWAIWELGRQFSFHVAIQPDHQLITRGPYRWFRHPSYTGTLVTLIGLPLALGTWIAAVVAAVLFLLGHSYRIRVEEAALAEAFGPAYDDYRARTWRLFPGW